VPEATAGTIDAQIREAMECRTGTGRSARVNSFAASMNRMVAIQSVNGWQAIDGFLNLLEEATP